MKVKAEIVLVVGWLPGEKKPWCWASEIQKTSESNQVGQVRDWAADDQAEGVRTYIVEAEVDLPKMPPVERVQGTAREVKP